MKRHTITLFPLFFALFFVMNGCGGPKHRISGTDMPLVPGTAVKTNDLKSSRGLIQSGEVTFTGAIFDALERARWTARGFEKDGWAQQSLTGTPERATAIFTQALPKTDNERVATVNVISSQVRGIATITVEVRPITGSATKPDAAEGAVPAETSTKPDAAEGAVPAETSTKPSTEPSTEEAAGD
jgi:hypothetical protein